MAIGRNLGSSNVGGTRAVPGRMGNVGAGKAGSIGAPGKPDATPSRAEKRMASIKESMQASKTTATSAAHAGVVARPMDKNLSKMLEQRRAQMQSSGTSVARLGKESEMNQPSTLETGRMNDTTHEQGASSVGRLGQANSREGLAAPGTSAARLSTGRSAPSYLPPPPQKPPNKPPTDQPPVIDVFGDL